MYCFTLFANGTLKIQLTWLDAGNSPQGRYLKKFLIFVITQPITDFWFDVDFWDTVYEMNVSISSI